MPEYTDKRLTLPAAGRGDRLQVNCAVTALRKAPEPDAEMVSQILLGETVLLHHETGEFGLVQCVHDRYVGWALMAALSTPCLTPTHRITTPRLHAYAAPSIRAAPYFVIGIGAQVQLTGESEGAYVKTARAGWIREQFTMPRANYAKDPAEIAAQFQGTPYLWGGRDCLGMDCSGLVQVAFGACGIAAPRDSDMQYAWFGENITDWHVQGQLQRNDLVFWDGHVGIMLDAETLLHANAHHMVVAAEPLPTAISRIAPTYGDPIGARRVLNLHPDTDQPDWLIPR